MFSSAMNWKGSVQPTPSQLPEIVSHADVVAVDHGGIDECGVLV